MLLLVWNVAAAASLPWVVYRLVAEGCEPRLRLRALRTWLTFQLVF